MNVPDGEARGELTVRRSRFIGRAAPLGSPEEAREAAAAERAAHPGCDHVAYAYVLGSQGGLFGMSDDREPKGTAGRAILEVVKGSGVTNLLLTVTRYFGGTKLGTGGLARAYAETALETMRRLRVRALTPMRGFALELPYELYAPVERAVAELGGRLERTDFQTQVSLFGSIPEEAGDALVQRVLSLSGGRCCPLLGDDSAGGTAGGPPRKPLR